MKIRQSLFALLREIIERDRMPGWRIAKVCNTSHTRAWHLLHGRIEHFNTETIIDMLWRFGVDLDITVVREVPYAKFSITPTGRRRWYPRGDYDFGPPYAPVSPRHADGSPGPVSPRHADGSPAPVSPRHADGSPAPLSPRHADGSPAPVSPRTADGRPVSVPPPPAVSAHSQFDG